jgi:hypothetical protein
MVGWVDKTATEAVDFLERIGAGWMQGVHKARKAAVQLAKEAVS